MAKVFANGLSILNEGHGQTHVSSVDVCLTPGASGATDPIPYTNTASDSDLSDGSSKVQIEDNDVAIEDAELDSSDGDAAGTSGGVISGRTQAKLTWALYSTDVKCEDKGVVRFLDPTMHNGSSPNDASANNGSSTS